MRWIAVVLGMAVAVSVSSGPAVAAGWSAGASKVDISPTEPVWMAGYASRKTPSEGVAMPIHARALVLQDEAGTRALFLTVDVAGLRRALTDRVKERITKETGIPSASIAIVASHTHGAPMPVDNPERAKAYGIAAGKMAANEAWTKTLEDKLVRISGEAVAALRPVSLSHGTGEAPFAVNRREPVPGGGFTFGANLIGPTDRRVPVLKALGEDGTLEAVVFGYACHCTSMVADMLRIHGDYAGVAADTIERAHPGAVALFLTGCGADANPYPRGRMSQTVTYGGQLADAVESVLAGATMRALSGALKVATAEPKLTFGGPTDRASYEARVKESDKSSPRKSHAERMIARIDAGEPIVTSYSYPVQAFALGDQLTLVTLAGEVVVDYAMRIEQERKGEGPAVWVSAYANDVFGYIPSARVLAEGGYEGGEAFYYSTFPTPFAGDVEETIMGAVRETTALVRMKDE